MPITRPYYRLHQIISGQYATLGEFVTQDGKDYEGPYHVLPNGNVFSHYRPSDQSVQLFYRRIEVHPNSEQYDKAKGIVQRVSKYTAPKFHICKPTLSDYDQGSIERYFAQRKNDPRSTIVEISSEDFTRANKQNAPGIDLNLYNTAVVKWTISKVPSYAALEANRREVSQVSLSFLGLDQYLTDFLEFFKDPVA